MSRRIAVEVFEAIPARRERPSSAGGGGWVGESPPPRCFRSSRAEPPKAFPPHATWPIPQDVWTFGGIRCAGSALRSVSLEHVRVRVRSEEHTSELQSLMRISYAVFCLKKKKN